MLKDRYGDPQVLISSHMNKVLSLDSIRNIQNLKGLRSLCDQVESQVRCLISLGHDLKSYGLMLIPVFMTKIPEELKLIISRKLEKDIWDIEIILKTFKLEIEAREKVQVSLPSLYKDEFEMSASTIYAANNHGHTKFNRSFTPRTCPFCFDNHKAQYSQWASVVQRTSIRRPY